MNDKHTHCSECGIPFEDEKHCGPIDRPVCEVCIYLVKIDLYLGLIRKHLKRRYKDSDYIPPTAKQYQELFEELKKRMSNVDKE